MSPSKPCNICIIDSACLISVRSKTLHYSPYHGLQRMLQIVNVMSSMFSFLIQASKRHLTLLVFTKFQYEKVVNLKTIIKLHKIFIVKNNNIKKKYPMAIELNICMVCKNINNKKY